MTSEIFILCKCDLLSEVSSFLGGGIMVNTTLAYASAKVNCLCYLGKLSHPLFVLQYPLILHACLRTV